MQGQVQKFSSAPQAVGSRKYRDPNETNGRTAANIAWDRRVVRGNTYAALVQPEQDMAEIQKQREAQRRRLMRANQTSKRPSTPEAVPGRKHTDIQTDSYLEELTERTVEFEAETQTDFILDRPPSPLFMPAKIGVDIETQIEEGELFDFDVECEPVLEVLVGKTLEQSMMEVLEEEELASLQRHQEDFEKKRNAELLEVQRMEAAEKRRHDEMQRRVEQQKAQHERDLATMRKVLSRNIASQHLEGLKDTMLLHLNDAGVFADNLKSAVENKFMPNLFKMVSKKIQENSKDRQIADSVANSAVAEKLEKHSEVLDVERRRLAKIDEAERQARVEKAENLARRQAEAEKVRQQQELMMEWEAFVPDPPPKPDELEITEIKAEEFLAVFADGSSASVPEDQLAELQELFAQEKEEGMQLLGKSVVVEPPEGEDPPSEPKTVLASFRIGKPGEGVEAPGEAADGDGAEPA
eukprot:TRINITY_DN1980_c0_g1_i1.p1 TRINITY_DN1980_c0_g1~~TRINITY_DN1980_c0_g1_i1.p1  ORF type:complete len:504 (-),score=152.38 TRINITY_DN1980_c0_g1_i1:186-1589(-)